MYHTHVTMDVACWVPGYVAGDETEDQQNIFLSFQSDYIRSSSIPADDEILAGKNMCAVLFESEPAKEVLFMRVSSCI